jgi:D-inositol-3-phosphate glycosyltransferase
MLRDEGLDVELHVAGAFHSPADREAADAPGVRLGGAVRFHGVVEGSVKLDLLRSADVLAFPSYYANEGHPYVVIEAMAAGLPVVATPHAGIAETVLDGETGLLVPPRQPAALADALRSLVTDPERRGRLGAAGRRRFEEKYSFEEWSRGLDRIMADALS